MNYNTRAMVALRDLNHGNLYLRKGETFHATQVDADYLESRKQAAPAGKDAAAAPAPALTPAPTPKPTAAPTLAPTAAPEPEPSAQEQANENIVTTADVGATFTDVEPAPATRTTRGPAAKTTTRRG